MSSKSFLAYRVVVRKIQELAPSLNIEKLTSDFETAIRKAFLENFPELKKIIGCYFHYRYVSMLCITKVLRIYNIL